MTGSTATTEKNASILTAILKRPVAVLLGHVCLVLFGILGWSQLPSNRMPDVEYPTLMVTASFPGATPELMAQSVAPPLESRLCGLSGLLDCITSCGPGSVTITLRFRTGVDMGTASGEVGRAIQASATDLPKSMIEPPKYTRFNPTDTPLIYLALESPSTPEAELEELAQRLVVNRFTSISGAARVQAQGGGKLSWVVRTDPLALAQRGISPATVLKAIQNQSNQYPVGNLSGPVTSIMLEGIGPAEGTKIQADQIAIPTGHSFDLKAKPPVWLSDVATVTAEPSKFRSGHWRNGNPCVIVAVFRETGSNSLELANKVLEMAGQIQATLPAGAHLHLVHDNSQPIRSSLNEMMITLALSLILVMLIIGIGLRDWKGTIIACSVVPVTLVAMAGFMWLAGFSLNTFTLLALSLAIGFVVDDAVVVLENVIRHREMGKDPVHASHDGATEVAFTMLSITVSLLAVFLPILLIPDMLGKMFREFALTIMGCITLSGLVSLLLVPALSLWLPVGKVAINQHTEKPRISTNSRYQRFLAWMVAHPSAGLAGLVIFFVATLVVSGKVRKGFLPEEDKSILLLFTQAEPQASWENIRAAHRQVWDILAEIPEVEQHLTTLGQGEINASPTEGTLLLKIKPLPRRAIAEIASDIRQRLEAKSRLNCKVLNIPSLFLNTKQTKSLYQVLVTSPNAESLPSTVKTIQDWMAQRGDFLAIDSDLEPGGPTLEIRPNRQLLAMAGFSATDSAAALHAAFGPTFAANLWTSQTTRSIHVGFTESGLEYPNTLDLVSLGHGMVNPQQTTTPQHGATPLGEFSTLNSVVMSRQANRYNRLPAASISFNLPATGDASQILGSLETMLATLSNHGVNAELVGIAREVRASVARATPLVLLSFVIMYLTLGFLYESLTHPITVLATLPSALLGGLAGLWLFDIEMDIYGFLGLLMLLGLVKKNAIMLVDFARQRQREGVDPKKAILEASIERLRPIQLTTIAAAAGAVPMLLGTGSGVSVLKPVGAILLGGLLVSQVVTLLLTPPFYRVMESISRRVLQLVRWSGS